MDEYEFEQTINNDFIEVTFSDQYILNSLLWEFSPVIELKDYDSDEDAIDLKAVEYLKKSKKKIRLWISPSSNYYDENFQIWSEEAMEFQMMCEALKGEELYIVEVPEAKYIEESNQSNLYNYCSSFRSPDELKYINPETIQKRHLQSTELFGLELTYYKMSNPDKKYPFIENKYRQLYLYVEANNHEEIIDIPANTNKNVCCLKFVKFLTDSNGIKNGAQYTISVPKSIKDRMKLMTLSGYQYGYSSRFEESDIYGDEPIFVEFYLTKEYFPYTIIQDWTEREMLYSNLYLKCFVDFSSENND